MSNDKRHTDPMPLPPPPMDSAAELDAKFDAAMKVLEEFVPEEPVREELVVNGKAPVRSRGNDAAGAYVGPSTLPPGQVVRLPTSKVKVVDPSRRAATVKIDRSLIVPFDAAEQGLVTPVDGTHVRSGNWRTVAAVLMIGSVTAGVVVWMWRETTPESVAAVPSVASAGVVGSASAPVASAPSPDVVEATAPSAAPSAAPKAPAPTPETPIPKKPRPQPPPTPTPAPKAPASASTPIPDDDLFF